jgi:hypothetical protein
MPPHNLEMKVYEREGEIMALKKMSQELDRLEIDEKTHRIYWDGEEVVVRSGFFLLPLERWIAIVAASAATTTVIVNVTRFLVVDLQNETLKQWLLRWLGH